MFLGVFRAVRGATYFPPARKVGKGAVKGKPFRLGFPLTIPFLNDQEGRIAPLGTPTGTRSGAFYRGQ